MNDMTNRSKKMRGRAASHAAHPLIRLAIGLILYFISFFMMGRYGNAVIARLLAGSGIDVLSSYAAASLRLFGILIVILIIMLLIRQFHVFFQRRRGFFYGVFVGGYMFIYSVIGFISVLPGAESFQDRNTIVFSILYFILVGITEELIFRGVTADLLLQLFFQRNPKKKPVIPAIIISGIIFSMAHAVNARISDVSGVLVQMTAAFFLGMFLTTVYYRSRNIYAVIFLHLINDLAAAVPITILKSDVSITDVISGYGAADLALLIPYVVALVFVLRPKKLDEVRHM